MKIKDLNGFEIEVENLQLAIAQADDYRRWVHIDTNFRYSDEKLKAYWEDIYQKLISLDTA
jgi:hypothetical protein